MLMVGELYDYLSEAMGDREADDYINQLMAFGNSLETKSTHHSFCRNKKLQSRGFRCALFRKKYILIYTVDEVQVNILGVLHSKRSPEAFENLVD